MQTSLARLKEQHESINGEKAKLQDAELRNQEAMRKLTKQLRDAREENVDIQKREAEATLRKAQLVSKNYHPIDSLNNFFLSFFTLHVFTLFTGEKGRRA